MILCKVQLYCRVFICICGKGSSSHWHTFGNMSLLIFLLISNNLAILTPCNVTGKISAELPSYVFSGEKSVLLCLIVILISLMIFIFILRFYFSLVLCFISYRWSIFKKPIVGFIFILLFFSDLFVLLQMCK